MRRRRKRRVNRHKGEGHVERMASGSYRIVVTVEGERLYFYGETLSEAQAKLAAWKAGSTTRPDENLRVREWLDRWFTSREGSVEPTTLDGERGLGVHLKRVLGRLYLGELSTGSVSRFYASLRARGGSADLARKCGRLLRAVLKAAVKARLIPTNPAAEVPLPKASGREMLCWTAREAASFLKSCEKVRDPYAWLYRLALDSGLRFGELAGLRWGDIDWDLGALHVRRSVQDRSGRLRFKEPKSRHGRRTVRLSRTTLMALRKVYRGRKPNLGEAVWLTEEGGPVRRSNFSRRHWSLALTRSGIRPIRFHDLRHTSASLLLAAGVPVHVVSRRLGHADITITLKAYGHVLPESEDAVPGVVEKLLKGV